MLNEPDFISGEVLLIDKPLKWTSFDVVNKIRYTLKNILQVKKIKVGHAGTLDPLATGLLIICTGKKTKEIDQYQAQEKEYTGRFVLGKTTPSIDLETPFDTESDISHIVKTDIHALEKVFSGTIMQVPPMYSAIKLNGERMYHNARKGKEVRIEPREVKIESLKFTNIDLPYVSFEVSCSKGTYIRSLVRDIGKKLGVGAYLDELRRTRIGEFKIQEAKSLDDFLKAISNPHQ